MVELAELFRQTLATPTSPAAARRIACEGLGATSIRSDGRTLAAELASPASDEVRIAAAAALLRLTASLQGIPR
jgi:hypothetical protein